MLARGSPLNTLTHLEGDWHGAEVWPGPSLYWSLILELWGCHVPPLCLLVASHIYSKVLPGHAGHWQPVFRCHFHVDIWKPELWPPLPAVQTGRSFSHHTHSPSLVLTRWDRIQAFLLNLRGSSKLLSVAVSKCMFANRYHLYWRANKLNVPCTSASTVPTGAMKCVRSLPSGGLKAALTTVRIVLCGKSST